MRFQPPSAHRRTRAAVGAEAVALMPAHQRFRHCDGGEFARRNSSARGDGAQIFHADILPSHQVLGGGGADAHAENRRTFVQAEKDGAGIGAEFVRFIQRQQCAGTIGAQGDHQRIAMDHIGPRVAMGFQREQFFGIGADMRRAVDRMRHEAGLSERKGIVLGCH